MIDPGLDHLVYATPDLAASVAEIAGRTGVAPVEGGPHVGLGTRNHLLGLGGRAYLEIVGPDPGQPAPERPRPFGIDDLAAPALVAWAVAVEDIDGRVARARAAGFDPGDAVPMARRRPDGVLLEWRLTPVRTGAVPFLIDWGRTEHPAAALPVVPLRTFRIVDPEPARVRAPLGALGVAADLRAGERPALRAEIGDGLVLE